MFPRILPLGFLCLMLPCQESRAQSGPAGSSAGLVLPAASALESLTATAQSTIKLPVTTSAVLKSAFMTLPFLSGSTALSLPRERPGATVFDCPSSPVPAQPSW